VKSPIGRVWALWGVALVVLATTAFAVARLRSPAGEWVRVDRTDLVLGADITGTLKAVDSSQIGPPQVADVWEFKISFLAPEGAKVTRGRPVLGFDTNELQRELERKTAERDSVGKQLEKKRAELELAGHDDGLALAQAEADLSKAQLKAERPPELVADKQVRENELDRALAVRQVAYLNNRIVLAGRAAKAEMAALANREHRAAARVGEIERAIARMTVTAPRDGTVIYLTNWRDEKKKMGDSCWRAERVLEIPDLGAMMGRAEADEADAGVLAAGQPVTLRLDALPDVEFTGRVSTCARVVERKSWENPTRIVRLDVALDRTDSERMRPGMRFRGTVETGRLAKVVVIPIEAVRASGSGAAVVRRTALGTALVPVTLGKRNQELVEVISGIGEGDEILARTAGTGAGR